MELRVFYRGRPDKSYWGWKFVNFQPVGLIKLPKEDKDGVYY